MKSQTYAGVVSSALEDQCLDRAAKILRTAVDSMERRGEPTADVISAILAELDGYIARRMRGEV